SYTGHGPCLYLRPSTNLRKISGVIQNPINDYVVNLHIYIRIIATRAGKNCAKKVRRIYLHSTQSMQQHYSSKPIEQNSKSRLAQPQDGFDDNGEAVLAYFLEAFTASTAFCSD
ncbi:hypothetical protein, partial [Bifidobacterium longum]|uniref:hypothetical protein n=1 Tax=Bifidobacterium longum TaxID=216816 RepID=UPI003219903C